MAALNCTALGARGGIATVQEVKTLVQRAERRCHRDFELRADFELRGRTRSGS
jgi:hypothetical protein